MLMRGSRVLLIYLLSMMAIVDIPSLSMISSIEEQIDEKADWKSETSTPTRYSMVNLNENYWAISQQQQQHPKTSLNPNN